MFAGELDTIGVDTQQSHVIHVTSGGVVSKDCECGRNPKSEFVAKCKSERRGAQ